jgi:hypothetical protein
MEKYGEWCVSENSHDKICVEKCQGKSTLTDSEAHTASYIFLNRHKRYSIGNSTVVNALFAKICLTDFDRLYGIRFEIAEAGLGKPCNAKRLRRAQVRSGLPPNAYTGYDLYPKRLEKYIFTGKKCQFFYVYGLNNAIFEKNRLTCTLFGITMEVIH